MKVEKIKLIETIVVIDEKKNDIIRKVFIEVFFSGASDELMSKTIRCYGSGSEFELFDRKDHDSRSFLLTINKFIFGRRVVSYWSKSPVPYFMKDETIKRLSFELSSSSCCFKKDSFLNNTFFKGRRNLVRYEEDIITKEELYNLLVEIYWTLRDRRDYRNSNFLEIFWMICDEMET